MIDQSLLGSTVSKCMDEIEENPPTEDVTGDLEMVAVGIVVVISDGDGSWTKTYCSDHWKYEQVGLFNAALSCVGGA